MTFEVRYNQRWSLTQLQITEEWITSSVLQTVWKCVLMFCEWTEMGVIVPVLCWLGLSELICTGSSASWLFITSFSPLACLLCFLSVLAVALVAAVPEGMHNSRALSVSVSLFTMLRKRLALFPKWGHFLRKLPHLPLDCTTVLYLS